MISVDSVDVSFVDYDKIGIECELVKSNENLDDYSFYVQRIHGEDVIAEITVTPTEFYFNVVDYLHTYHINDDMYYSIRVVNKDTAEEKIFGPYSPYTGAGNIAKEIIRKKLIQLRTMGTTIRIYKKMLTGVRCECWDPVLNKSLRSNCPICGGTGIVRGYYDPIDIKASLSHKFSVSADKRGDLEQKMLQVRMLNFPLMRQDDVIELPKFKEIYRVSDVSRTTFQEAVISQTVQAALVPANSIKLPKEREQ